MADAELHSWKEIAEYLGVAVRTAQYWNQQRGLPVRRLPGGRGQVSALTAELDAWRTKGNPLPEHEVASPPAALAGGAALPRRRPARVFWVAGTVCALMLVGYLLVGVALRPGVPASVHVDRHILIATDNSGREVWRHAFPQPLNVDPRSPDRYRYEWFGDVDGDGQPELVYSRDFGGGKEPSALVCFSRTGVVKWEFVPGYAVSSRRQAFPPPYRVVSFVVFQIRPTDPQVIVVVAYNAPDYATQVALLSGNGKQLREYWHSGYIGRWGNLEVTDLNGDGATEVYLGGVNNAYNQATLVVLDPRDFGGASVEERSDYQILGFAPGNEAARILFPKGCIARKLNPLYNDINCVVRQADGLLRVEVAERPDMGGSVEYRFGPDLQVRSITLTDDFRRAHAALHAAGQLDHALAATDEAAFHDLRYLHP